VGACTGWLIGNEGHLLTNNHCISNQSQASSATYEFMAEGSCGTDCSVWGSCAGDVVADSATLIKANAALDYALLKLPGNPSQTYGYLTLRASGAVVGERVYVPQHPSAMGKRIAVYSSNNFDNGYARIYSTNAAACTGGSRDIGYYADTRGGSSGAPVIGYDDHRVVALHHCANCPNRGVPVEAIIEDLGDLLPSSALGGSAPPVLVMNNGELVANLSATKGLWRYFSLSVPAGQDHLQVETWGGLGDVELYVRRGGLPTQALHTEQSSVWGNREKVRVEKPEAGVWYIGLRAKRAYRHTKLTGSYK
jgi:hypothetical protein